MPLSYMVPAMALLTMTVSCAQAQVGAVRVRMEQTSKSDTTSYKTVQSRSLNVFVSNSSKEALELKVKWAVFGRDLKDQQIVTIEQGELPVSVKPQGTEKIQTPQVRTAAEEERIGSKGKSEAGGSRIIGQGVQVMKGDTLVAEAYEPPSLRDSFGKAPPALKLEKKKK